jgi:hypothetical protein
MTTLILNPETSIQAEVSNFILTPTLKIVAARYFSDAGFALRLQQNPTDALVKAEILVTIAELEIIKSYLDILKTNITMDSGAQGWIQW